MLAQIKKPPGDTTKWKQYPASKYRAALVLNTASNRKTTPKPEAKTLREREVPHSKTGLRHASCPFVCPTLRAQKSAFAMYASRRGRDRPGLVLSKPLSRRINQNKERQGKERGSWAGEKVKNILNLPIGRTSKNVLSKRSKQKQYPGKPFNCWGSQLPCQGGKQALGDMKLDSDVQKMSNCKNVNCNTAVAGEKDY